MAKKVLVSGYIGFSNFGDDVIFSMLSRHLKAQGFEVIALSSNPKKTSAQFKVKAYNYKKIPDIIKAIQECDFVISGGGTLLQNATSNKSLLYYASIILFAKMLMKKVIIYAQGIGPISGNFWQWLAKLTLSSANLVTVRDRYSLRLLNKWNIKSHFVRDPAWDMPIVPRENQKIVGVQLRACDKMYKNFIQDLAKYVGIYFSDRKIQIFSLQGSQDTDICYKFERELRTQWPNTPTQVIVESGIKKTIEDFAKLDYLIAMRFHACLLGLKYKIKTMPISYDIKIDNLAKEFEIPYMIDVSKSNQDLNDKFRVFVEYKEPTRVEQRRNERFDWTVIDEFMNK